MCEGSNGEGRQRSKHSSAFLQVLFRTRRVCAREAPWAQRRSAECGPQLRERTRSAPKDQLPSNRPGSCEHHRQGFSPKGRLESVELGVPSLFECICENKEGPHSPLVCECGCVSDRCPGWKVSRPMSHPHARLRTVGSSGVRGTSHSFLQAQGARGQSPASAETRAPSAPRAPHRGLPLSRRWLRAGQPFFFQHKGFEVRCFLWRKALAGSE